MRGGGSEGVVGEPVAQDRQAYCSSYSQAHCNAAFLSKQGGGRDTTRSKVPQSTFGTGIGDFDLRTPSTTCAVRSPTVLSLHYNRMIFWNPHSWICGMF